MLERAKEHVSKNPGKNASESVNKSCKKGQNGSAGSKRKRGQEKKQTVKCLKSDSQKPGTSGVSRCVNEWAIDIESGRNKSR